MMMSMMSMMSMMIMIYEYDLWVLSSASALLAF